MEQPPVFLQLTFDRKESSCGKFGQEEREGKKKRRRKNTQKKYFFEEKSETAQDLMIFPGKMMHSSLFSVFRVSI